MAQITAGDGDPRHGTVNGYSNLGCRGEAGCQPCKDAWAETHKAYMHSHPEAMERHRQRRRERYAEQKAARA